MLREKIDCAKFLTWFIEKYPESVEEARKEDGEYRKQKRLPRLLPTMAFIPQIPSKRDF